jgi:membrane-bound serine protease (ClpP class)
MREKIETMIRARMRANAEANGHPGKLLEAMVTKKMALYRITYGDDEQAFLTGEELELLEEQIESGESDRAIADRKLVVSEKRLLTLTAGEAREYGLAEGVAESLDAFYAARGVPVLDRVLHRPPEMVKHEMSMGWKALLVLCLIIGVAGAIVEAGVPGFGVPGVIGIIGFACFFIILAGHGRADAPEVLLFAAGVALILVEIFIIPGFGVAGIAGLLCLLGAFVLLYLPPFDSETMRRDWAGELEGMTVFFSIGGVLAIVAGWLLAAYAPRIPLVKSAILGMRLRSGKDIQAEVARDRDADRYRHEVDGEHTESDLKGVEGVTTTVLRPSGKIRADDGRALDVVSEGPVIAQGERVRVVEVNGPRITVAPVEEDSA